MWKKMQNKSFNSRNELMYVLIFIKNNFFNQFFLFTSKKKSLLSDFNNFYKTMFDIFFWIKIRILYYVNNWIYTTNHKRIAVNYFWFVILSGIVGMVLATLLRLEFAYPGAGVFAGDSLQYLSMVTAHGVIMVFFMIMPLLLGAFANFLIPTQLGVHDVAFPRLNSAAFWFLPGGLLMLCQLVCVDRRYQRMNCFNIREIQSILKRKFFTDLINTHDHHTLLDKTALGLRFKTNNINSFNSNIFVFYNYGIEFAPKIRSNTYIFLQENNFSNIFSFNNGSFFFQIINFFYKSNFFFFLNNLYLLLISNFFYLTSITYLFKNIFDNCTSFILYFYDYSVNFFYLLLNSLNNFFSIFYNLFKNYNSLFNILISSPLWVLSYLFTSFLNIINNNVYFYLNFYNFNIFSFNLLPNFNISSFNFSNFLLDYFFIPKIFEFIYIYKTSTKLNNIYYNYIYFISPFIDFYNNILFFWLSSDSYNSNNKTILLKIIPNNDKASNTSENLLSEKTYALLTNSNSLFNNSFNFKFDYNSYFVYFYIILYLLSNIPYFVFTFFKNIFDFKEISYYLFVFYESLTTWYIPSIFDDNIFYSFLKYLDFDISLNLKNKVNFFFKNINLNFNEFLNFFANSSLWSLKSNLFSFVNFNNFNNLLSSFFSSIFSILTNVINLFTGLFFSFKTNSFFLFVYNFLFLNDRNIITNNFNKSKNNYLSNYFNNSDLTVTTKYTNEETSDSFRYLRFYNPVFKYDYKSGDYFPKLYKEVYSYLFTSANDVTNSVRTSPWFLSEKYIETFGDNFFNYTENMANVFNFDNVVLHSWKSPKLEASRFSHTDAFYNLFYTLSNDFNYTNKKWIALNSLNQKFYRMFNTSSMQQRIYSNWRQLKFTREAWRCKLLAARHQKTLFRRYVHEDGVFWSIERNAKDLLPGWAMITPFSSRTRFTAIGKTDIGLMGVFLVINSSIISGANFLVTYRYLSTLNNRKMRDARVFFTESVIVSCWMMIFANPMLAIAILMLLSDRHWQTSFFDYSGGGDTVLFQHMFWFFGHPEVYIIIIPSFGFVNSIISYNLRKRVSARASLMYSMYTIAFLGFFVWGHHMYMVGLAHTTRMLFSTLTVMISVPAATKIMHWCVTTVNSAIALELPLLFTFTFIFLFVSGGISGMCVAHTGMDVLFHDTFYVIGHFHVMLAGSAMFSSFGGFYFYFPAIFGVKYSRIYAYLHYVYYLLGQLMTVIPMFWLGYAGMPRRVLDYPASMGGWHSVISAGHMLSVAGLMAFFIMIFDSLRQGRAVTRNTFGISRYNTCLNFYLYEISRLTQIQQKGLSLFRFIKPTSIKLNNLNYFNFEPLETTLMTYVFSKK